MSFLSLPPPPGVSCNGPAPPSVIPHVCHRKRPFASFVIQVIGVFFYRQAFAFFYRVFFPHGGVREKVDFLKVGAF